MSSHRREYKKQLVKSWLSERVKRTEHHHTEEAQLGGTSCDDVFVLSFFTSEVLLIEQEFRLGVNCLSARIVPGSRRVEGAVCSLSSVRSSLFASKDGR